MLSQLPYELGFEDSVADVCLLDYDWLMTAWTMLMFS